MTSAMTMRFAGAKCAWIGLLSALGAIWLGCEADPIAPNVLGEPACQELRVEEPATNGNLILVLNDTMRRDYLGVYGGRARTPNLDAFARANLVFENAITQAPWTKPSVATLFTSLYPSQHRLTSHPQLRKMRREGESSVESDTLAPSFETLAEVMRMRGIRTAAFVSNPWMARSFGFEQGFEIYDDSFARWGISSDGNEVIEAGLAWLATLKPGERYFLYLHTIDSHRPYGPVPIADLESDRRRFNDAQSLDSPDARNLMRSIRIRDGERAANAGFVMTEALVQAAYQSGIEEFDGIFGRLMRGLDAQGTDWERTAMVVTSDHGESLFERGWGNHGGQFYDEEVTVPMAARLPGVQPAQGSVECLVGLVDLMPSLCEYMELTCPTIVQGWSFLSSQHPAHASERRYLVTEGTMRDPARRSIRNRRFKLVYEPPDPETGTKAEYELFDLETDAEEATNRLDSGYRSAEIDSAFDRLRDALPDAVAKLPVWERSAAPVDDELRERLEALGYSE